MRHAALRIGLVLLAILIMRPFAHGQTQEPSDPPQVSVSAHLEKVVESSVTISVVIKNEGVKAVYIVTRPKRADGSDGPYISIDPNDPSRLIAAMRFYPLPSFEVFKYDAGVHLYLLAAGASHGEQLTLAIPLKTTEPPFSDRPGTQLIPLSTIKSIQVQIGVLPVTDALSNLVHRKGPHDLFTGMEESDNTDRNHSIHSDQELFSSTPVHIAL